MSFDTGTRTLDSYINNDVMVTDGTISLQAPSVLLDTGRFTFLEALRDGYPVDISYIQIGVGGYGHGSPSSANPSSRPNNPTAADKMLEIPIGHATTSLFNSNPFSKTFQASIACSGILIPEKLTEILLLTSELRPVAKAVLNPLAADSITAQDGVIITVTWTLSF